MGLILLEGLVVTALVLTGLREQIMRAIPLELKKAIAIGIGLNNFSEGLAIGASIASGALTFRLTVRGRATHASRRTSGVSAIEKFIPVFAQTRSELRARYEQFHYLPEPIRAMAVNLLQRFHDKVAEIAAVEITT